MCQISEKFIDDLFNHHINVQLCTTNELYVLLYIQSHYDIAYNHFNNGNIFDLSILSNDEKVEFLVQIIKSKKWIDDDIELDNIGDILSLIVNECKSTVERYHNRLYHTPQNIDLISVVDVIETEHNNFYMFKTSGYFCIDYVFPLFGDKDQLYFIHGDNKIYIGEKYGWFHNGFEFRCTNVNWSNTGLYFEPSLVNHRGVFYKLPCYDDAKMRNVRKIARKNKPLFKTMFKLAEQV